MERASPEGIHFTSPTGPSPSGISPRFRPSTVGLVPDLPLRLPDEGPAPDTALLQGEHRKVLLSELAGARIKSHHAAQALTGQMERKAELELAVVEGEYPVCLLSSVVKHLGQPE